MRKLLYHEQSDKTKSATHNQTEQEMHDSYHNLVRTKLLFISYKLKNKLHESSRSNIGNLFCIKSFLGRGPMLAKTFI